MQPGGRRGDGSALFGKKPSGNDFIGSEPAVLAFDIRRQRCLPDGFKHRRNFQLLFKMDDARPSAVVS